MRRGRRGHGPRSGVRRGPVVEVDVAQLEAAYLADA